MKRLQEALTERATLVAEVSTYWDQKGDEPISLEEKSKVGDQEKRIRDLDEEIKDLNEQQQMRHDAKQRYQADNTPVNRLGMPNAGSGNRAEVKTLGEAFTSGVDFKDWLGRVAPRGHVPSKTHIQSPPMEFAGLKALITGLSSTSGGAFVTNDRLNIVDAGTFGRPLTIRSLVTNGDTDSDTVEYVRQGTHVNNAAPVAEATGAGDGTGAKPESDMLFSVVTETVKTIAHWVPITNRALADAGQLRMMIDNFLRYGLEEELEDQMINGSGAGENFTGILNTTGTSTQSFDTDMLTTTRKARTKVQTLGRATATAYVMHPLDWEALDLTQDAEDRYYFGGPMVMGTPRLWGLPVVESEAIAQGTAIVADWRLAALWDRQQATITMSNSHSDFFVRNLVAILAELRAAFGVIRPAAFVEVDMAA